MTTALRAQYEDITAVPLSEMSAELVSARALVSELIAGCPPGVLLDAEASLREHPELAHHKSALMELAYEDYCRRDDLGHPVEPTEFARRFPTIYRSLLHQLGIHQLLVDGAAGDEPKAAQKWPATRAAWLDFELLEELGRGAFSRVFLVRDQTLGGRLVVVKATPLGPREAQTLGRLQHPHVVPVHSVQRDHELGLTAVCMPFLSRVSMFDMMDELFSVPESGKHRVQRDQCAEEGSGSKGPQGSKRSKNQLMENGIALRRPPQRAVELLDAVRRLNAVAAARPDVAVEVPWPRHWRYADAVLQIGVQLAQALQHAHRQGVLHGDVKPSNILITNSGRAVLLDFNLAIFGDHSDALIAGTVPYMAPEQLRRLLVKGGPSEKSVDERADIFSLGLTLFELLYGEPAFGELPAENSRELFAGRLLERHKRGPKLPDGGTRDADRRIREVIVRCLAFDPARRPQSMEEVADLLAGELKRRRRLGRWLRAHRRLTLATTALICAVALAIGGWQFSRDPYPIREWKEAEAAFDRGDDAATVMHATEALRHDPVLVEAKLVRGLAYARQKDLIAARADLLPLTDQVPDGRAAAALAYAYTVADINPGLAGLYYQKAIDQGLRSPTNYNNLGNCLYQVSRFEESAVALETAVALDSQTAAAHHNLLRLEFRKAVRQRRVPDTTALEQLLRLGTDTAEVDLDAARLYALRSTFAENDAERAGAVERVFRFLEDGLSLGLTRQNLNEIAGLSPVLKADSRWPLLESRAQAVSNRARATLLIDPIPDLRRRPDPVAEATHVR